MLAVFCVKKSPDLVYRISVESFVPFRRNAHRDHPGGNITQIEVKVSVFITHLVHSDFVSSSFRKFKKCFRRKSEAAEHAHYPQVPKYPQNLTQEILQKLHDDTDENDAEIKHA